MAKHGSDPKIRLLAVENILRRGKKVTSTQILRELELCFGITADRKTIYADIMAIDRFVPIESMPGKWGGFQIVNVLGRCDHVQ